MGIRNDKSIPPIGTYQLATDFKKDEHRGFSFGSGREVLPPPRRKWSWEDL